jgi:hypothetical protein
MSTNVIVALRHNGCVHRQQICHKAGVSTVAVREHINGNEAMMVAGFSLNLRDSGSNGAAARW